MASRTTPKKSKRAPASTDKRFRKISIGGDHGTPERWQHSGRTLELTDRAGILACRATEEHILDVLALRRLLDSLQVQAALRFKADYHAASLSAHVTGSYSGASNARDFFHGEYERSDAQEAAYKRWRNAVRELGMHTSTAVIATVCHDAPPAPRDLPALQDGLHKLAAIYRMTSQPSLQNTAKQRQ
jgi:hypothetical protein